jgi:hypothetical protein
MLPPIDFIAHALPAAVLGGCAVAALSYIANRVGLLAWLTHTAAPDDASSDALESNPLASAGLELYCGSESELRASVAAAGLSLDSLAEVRLFSPRAGTPASQYPASVIALVSECRDAGAYRGAEIATLAGPCAVLPPNQCVWFCLEVLGTVERVTCFVATTPQARSSTQA